MGAVFAILAVLALSLPNAAHAGFFSSIFKGNTADAQTTTSPAKETPNSQNLAVLQANVSSDREGGKGGGDVTTENDTALVPEIGPLGTASDIKSDYLSDQIFNYVVRSGDTLAGIAKMFGVSKNTIIWANDLQSETLKVGATLVILPVSGVEYTIKKGDTLKKIANKYKADIDEIGKFNGLTEDSPLVIGDTIIIPDGEAAIVTPASSSAPRPKLYNDSGPSFNGFYIRPLVGGMITQKQHGHNGYDIGRLPVGSPVLAAAGGVVIVARDEGYNGGYGRYIVISHENGTQTVYGHLSSVLVTAGTQVNQGTVIGYLGNSGRSSGPHLHFEVRGGKNPFADNSFASR